MDIDYILMLINNLEIIDVRESARCSCVKKRDNRARKIAPCVKDRFMCVKGVRESTISVREKAIVKERETCVIDRNRFAILEAGGCP